MLQKSLREGFGLTVAEALWKAKPVIASAVGGIPLQIKHESSGILTHTIEGTAYWIKRLLNDPEYAHEFGPAGQGTCKKPLSHYQAPSRLPYAFSLPFPPRSGGLFINRYRVSPGA